MLDKPKPRTARKPNIFVSEDDYDRISEMAMGLEHRNPQLAKLVLDEIDRARICSSERLPKDVVALGSTVEFLDDASGRSRRMTLVVPHDADVEAGRISVMTPVGAGLIGMRAGAEIDWPCPDGRPRKLKIIAVEQRS